MRYEGVVIRGGAVLYRSRPLYCRHTAFAAAADWAEAHGKIDDTVTTQERR